MFNKDSHKISKRPPHCLATPPSRNCPFGGDNFLKAICDARLHQQLRRLLSAEFIVPMMWMFSGSWQLISERITEVV